MNLSDMYLVQERLDNAKEFVENMFNHVNTQRADYIDDIAFKENHIVVRSHTEFRGEHDESFEDTIPYEAFSSETSLAEYFKKKGEARIQALQELHDKQKADEVERLKIVKANEYKHYLQLKKRYEGTDE